jgi:hypothetical protein
MSADIGPGFYDAVDFEDYASIDAFNGSSIVHMTKSPLHYFWHKSHPAPPTPAMILGTVTHRMILEPHRIGDFAVWGENPEEKVRNGKVWDAFREKYAGHMIVNKADRDAMVGMAVAVRRNTSAAGYLRGGRSEVSMVWVDKAIGRLFKGRIDYLCDARKSIIVDLKTTRDCRPFKFGNQAYNLGYHIKLALYQNGYYALTGKMADVKIIAVEGKPPYETAVYNVPRDVLQQGQDDYAVLMKQILACEASGVWPGANEDEADLELPGYAFGDEQDIMSELELEA